jgi:putative membrane protein
MADGDDTRARDELARVDLEHPEPGSAVRRTYLASERTYLAWWRSGLAALALAVGVGRLVPEITSGPEWPWVVLGAGFGVLGVLAVVYGGFRQRQVTQAIVEQRFEPVDARVAIVMTVVAAALGVAVVALIFAGTS